MHSLEDEGLGVEDEGSEELGRDGVVLGPRLENQTSVAGELAVLHVLHRPFTCRTPHGCRGYHSDVDTSLHRTAGTA